MYLTDIYPAGEAPVFGIDSKALSDEIARFRSVNYVPAERNLVELLRKQTRQGDLLLTMGAGDIWQIGEAFLEENH